MRGIFSSRRGVRRPRLTLCSLSLGLTLLLVQAVGAQNVTIELTPITYPIVLPDSGGSFDYLLTVTNQGGSPITATVWCVVTMPNGNPWGPVMGPATQTLGAGQTQGIYRAQTIPSRAPFGYYTLHAYVGIYPDTIWAMDEFEFQHQAVSGTEQEWVARYDGLASQYDVATSLRLDNYGNIYVTGHSESNGTLADYVTLKYNSAGIQQWVARYNGPGNGDDFPHSLMVDGDGNVYVTGISWGRATESDFATIKYNSAGIEQWAARYNGQGNWFDWGTSLAVDGGGNVYVTGTSAENGTNHDCATIKYNSAGVQQWVAIYSGGDYGMALALDGDGNVLVTGYSEGATSPDYATVKYDSMGIEQWAAHYNGTGNSVDNAYSLAVDEGGNVYVTGRSYGSGNNCDYATIKYDWAGVEEWVVRYNGPGNDYDEAASLVVDADGNAYVTGTSHGIGTDFDYATIKYNQDGVEQWVARYNGPGNGEDRAYSLAVDVAGNVLVTGYSWGRIGAYDDYATIQYNAVGEPQWIARYNGPADAWDKAYSLGIDGGGNVFVTGESYGNATNSDYCTIKYSGGNIANWLPVEATAFGQPLPQKCRLEGNYPNPFNASTAFSYQLSANSYVRLWVYDTAGRLVETLVDGWRQAGVHELTFDAGELPSGMYFARLEAGEYMGVAKMILLK